MHSNRQKSLASFLLVKPKNLPYQRYRFNSKFLTIEVKYRTAARRKTHLLKSPCSMFNRTVSMLVFHNALLNSGLMYHSIICNPDSLGNKKN